MSGANVAVAMLVILGALLTILGLFGGGNLPIIALGLLAIAAGGVIGGWAGRASS